MDQFKLESKAVGKMMLLYLFIPSIVVTLLAIIFQSLGFAETEALTIANTLGISLTAIFILQRYTKKFKVSLLLQKPKADTAVILRYILFALGLSYLSNMILQLIVQALSSDMQFISPYLPNETTLTLIFNIIYGIILAPILEELVFRGLLLGYLKKFGYSFAILVVSLLFGLFHGNILQAFPTFFFSLVLCHLTLQCNSIYPAIIAHFILNFIGTFATILQENYLFLIITGISMMILLGFTILTILSAIRHHQWKQYEKSEYSILRFFSTWPFIIFLIYTLLSFISMITVL